MTDRKTSGVNQFSSSLLDVRSFHLLSGCFHLSGVLYASEGPLAGVTNVPPADPSRDLPLAAHWPRPLSGPPIG